jgi:hypothetical protein
MTSLLARLPGLAPLLAPHYLGAIANQPAALLEGSEGDARVVDRFYAHLQVRARAAWPAAFAARGCWHIRASWHSNLRSQGWAPQCSGHAAQPAAGTPRSRARPRAPQEAAAALVQQREPEPMAADGAAAAEAATAAATEAEMDGRMAGALTVVTGSVEIWRLAFREPQAFAGLLHAVLLSRCASLHASPCTKRLACLLAPAAAPAGPHSRRRSSSRHQRPLGQPRPTAHPCAHPCAPPLLRSHSSPASQKLVDSLMVQVFSRFKHPKGLDYAGERRAAACCLLPAARRLLPAACCLLPAACCLLPWSAPAAAVQCSRATIWGAPGAAAHPPLPSMPTWRAQVPRPAAAAAAAGGPGRAARRVALHRRHQRGAALHDAAAPGGPPCSARRPSGVPRRHCAAAAAAALGAGCEPSPAWRLAAGRLARLLEQPGSQRGRCALLRPTRRCPSPRC